MRLLFIYFYKTKGTFKEGTIIELSKKYSVKYLDKFKFKLTKRDSFQDNFYGDNIDIGAIIGENGTGKSLLVNSFIYPKNNYSLAIYEKGDKEFFYENFFDEEVSIYGYDIQLLNDVSFIYYSPIIDSLVEGEEKLSFDRQNRDRGDITFNPLRTGVENISDSFDFGTNGHLSFKKILNKIGFDNINYFLKMNKEHVKSHVNILGIKLNIKDFFRNIQQNVELDEYLKNDFSEFCRKVSKVEKRIKFLPKMIMNKLDKSIEELLFSLQNIENIKDIIDDAKKDKLLQNFYDRIKGYRDSLNKNDIKRFKEIVREEKQEAFILKYQYTSIGKLIDSNHNRKDIIISYLNKKIFKELNKEYREVILNGLSPSLKILIVLNSNITTIRSFPKKDILKIYLYLLTKEGLNKYLLDFIDNGKKIKNDMTNINEFKIVSDILKITSDELIVNFQEADIIIKFFENSLKSYLVKPFNYEVYPPLSSGQKAILFIFTRIDNAIKQIESKNITILLDEADLKLHLEWQRQFINDLVEFLKSYPDKNFYVLYATHSPMILSDITDDRIVFLKKEGDYSIDKSIHEKKSTFGTNIYDLYHDSFFMDRYMGEFAFNKINDVINIVNLYKISKEEKPINYRNIDIIKMFRSYKRRYKKSVENDCKKVQQTIEEDRDKLEQIAEQIGEPLLRNKLLRDIRAIGGYNENKVINALKNMSPKNRKDELSKHSKQRQIELLTKLLDEGDSNDKC